MLVKGDVVGFDFVSRLAELANSHNPHINLSDMHVSIKVFGVLRPYSLLMKTRQVSIRVVELAN